jgi:hypothetical protein
MDIVSVASLLPTWVDKEAGRRVDM